ncbi:MAG TPA: hypothetical protein VM537_10700, partial [Anaerolineae bacterium]|nr:hypothetical protein [Anaerolineae bacterium]
MSEEKERIASAMKLAEVSQRQWHLMPEQLKREVISKLRLALRDKDGWPRVYLNAETGRVY